MVNMLSKFPHLLPVNLGWPPTGFEGFIKLQKNEYIKISCPQYPSSENINVTGSVRLMTYLQNNWSQINPTQTVEEYLTKLQSCFIDDRNTKEGNYKIETFSLYSKIVCHLEELGWEKVAQVSEDFSSITLQLLDQKQRRSLLKIGLPPLYPEESPKFDSDLPYLFELKWSPSTHLPGIYKQWESEVNKLQSFWDVLDSIDQFAYVIDPEIPTRKHKSRRIMLENLVSVHITISISHPYSLPQWQFLGPASKVEPLNAKMIEKFNMWNDVDTPIRNLENILGLAIVEKRCKEDQPEDWDMECAVCYCLHLEDKLPDVHCEHCQKKFHLSCLFEWLRCLSTSRQSIQMIRGECPHCSKSIQCKVPKQ